MRLEICTTLTRRGPGPAVAATDPQDERLPNRSDNPDTTPSGLAQVNRGRALAAGVDVLRGADLYETPASAARAPLSTGEVDRLARPRALLRLVLIFWRGAQRTGRTATHQTGAFPW
jgi:hypothetical protein